MVSRTIFADDDIHRTEARRVFRRTWLLLGHESLLPEAGSFMTTRMGEDNVVVWRGRDGHIRAFLNSCPHRGNTVCLYDYGAASTMTCSYHGWAFLSDGRLGGVPFQERSYGADFDRDRNGLLEVPRVETYGGLVFGCWDPEVISLEAHLGELRWWLDAFLCNDDLGGMTAIPGTQRYRTPGNWKLFCDNFAGDRYHTPSSHASGVKLGLARAPSREQGDDGYFMAFLRPAHGLGGIFTNTAMYESELNQAGNLGAEVVDFVRHRWELLQKRVAGLADKPSHFSFGLCFPNFVLQGVGGALRGNLIGVCHPSGVHASEVQQWVLVERDAPESVLRGAARFVSRGQSAGGMIGPDDTENFERIDASLRNPMTERLTAHYGMGVGTEGAWPGHEGWKTDGLPGLIGPEFWEVGQRRFYAEWSRLMEQPG